MCEVNTRLVASLRTSQLASQGTNDASRPFDDEQSDCARKSCEHCRLQCHHIYDTLKRKKDHFINRGTSDGQTVDVD